MNESYRIASVSFPEDAPDSDELLCGKSLDAIISGIVEHSYFNPLADEKPPYDLELAVVDNRLAIRVYNAESEVLPVLVLSMRPYARLIRDYFLLCESFEDARKFATPSRLEAIDMGRRSLHNEGAELLIQRLNGKIEMDHETARKLFTLMCTLHGKRTRHR